MGDGGRFITNRPFSFGLIFSYKAGKMRYDYGIEIYVFPGKWFGEGFQLPANYRGDKC